jgi:hypothetical protein
MPFMSNPIHGKWWTEREGTKENEDNIVVRRGSRQIRVRRASTYEYRVYRNRTDGTDGNVIDVDSLALWNDPVEGEPTSAADWCVGEASMEFDMDSGIVELSVSSTKAPVDWQTSKVISRREFL